MNRVRVLGDSSMGSLTVDRGTWVSIRRGSSVRVRMASHRIGCGYDRIGRRPWKEGLLKVSSKTGL